MPAEGFVQLPPDGSGKKLAAFRVPLPGGGDEGYAEAVVLIDPDGATVVQFPLPQSQLDELKAALEEVTVSGTVGLNQTALDALENIVISGQVSLDAGTLSALENITVGGEVDLSASALAALESISALVTNFPVEFPLPGDQLLTLSRVTNRRFDAVDTEAAQLSLAGPTVIASPASGEAIDVLWVYAQGKASNAENAVEVTFRLGSRVLYVVEVIGSQTFSHSARHEGEVDEELTVELSPSGRPVYINADTRPVP